MPVQTITPFLWFDSQAEEAAELYRSIFPNSSLRGVTRFPTGAPGPAGSVTTVEFDLDGLGLVALNGGPLFKFTEAFSLVVNCQSQEEIDFYWERLSAGGEPGQCGWLKDRFGLSWQVVPAAIAKLVGGPDPENTARAMNAMLTMAKLNIAALEGAYNGP